MIMIMTKNKKKIIAFAGRQRSGKTQLAKLLKNEDDAVIVTIASALKKLCCDILGIAAVLSFIIFFPHILFFPSVDFNFNC